jgi:hypothetical protein
VLLGVVAVGLMGYVLWRSIQTMADPDGEGLDIGSGVWASEESSSYSVVYNAYVRYSDNQTRT